MPYLKGNLHTHTSFSDGALSPGEVAEIYADLGYDFVAITDHDYLVRPQYWESLPAQSGRLLVFKGLELEYAPPAYQHLGKIIGEKETLFVFNHPRQYGLSVAEVLWERVQPAIFAFKIAGQARSHRNCTGHCDTAPREHPHTSCERLPRVLASAYEPAADACAGRAQITPAARNRSMSDAP